MTVSLLAYSSSAVLLGAGVLISPANLIDFLRPISPPADLAPQLLLGAVLFKISLIAMGVWVIFVTRTFVSANAIAVRPSPNRPEPLHVVILFSILFIALMLRLHALDSGLWYDEILTYINYVKMPVGEIITTYDTQNQHFLYTVLAHASVQIFGESAWSLRIPAVLFGIGTIFALYLLASEVTDTREALLSAALLTFSYHHIWFSQNARGYTGLLFWTILSSWLLLRGIAEGRPRLWLLYAGATALGVYTHMTMLFVSISHLIIYLLAIATRRKEIWPNSWAGLILGFCFAGLLTFQLHALILAQIFTGTLWEGAERTITSWKNPLWTFVELVEGIKIGFAIPIVALVVFGAGVLSYGRKNVVVLQLFMIPMLISVAVFMAMGHPLWPRTFFFTIGFGTLLIIRGSILLGNLITKLVCSGATKSIPLGTALCVGLILVSAISVPAAYGPKQDYLGALTFVNERKAPSDTVVTVGIPATFPYQRFYKVDWQAVETVQELNSIRRRTSRTWLVYTMPLFIQSEYPEIMASIQRDFKVVKQFYGTLSGGTIFVCRSDLSVS